MIYEIDSSAVDKYAEKLATLHKSALPTAIRNTLNKAAFNVKQGTLADSAKKNFVNRDKNFFKANSTVKMATGWDIAKMQSEVGMIEKGLQGGSNNYAIKDLEQQEHGGKIDGKSFIAMRGARTGKNTNKKVRSNARMGTIPSNVTPINRRSGASRSQQFIRAAMYAIKNSDGYVLGHQTKGGGRTLWKVDSVSINVKSRRMRIKATPLYNVKKDRSVKVKATHFMEEAAMKSAKGMPKTFERAAEFQIKKHLG